MVFFLNSNFIFISPSSAENLVHHRIFYKSYFEISYKIIPNKYPIVPITVIIVITNYSINLKTDSP